MRILVTALAAALALAACTSTDDAPDEVTKTCRPVFFGVAGSGQGVQNPPPDVLPPGVTARDADRYGTTVALVKEELVELAGGRLAGATAIDYPATPLSRDIGPTGLLADLELSERRGVDRLRSAIRLSHRGGCADRPVLLAGYSQGAEVVIRAVNVLTAAERAHVAVALFGNPSYLPGKPGDYPGHTPAAGVRPAVLEFAYQLPAPMRSRVIDICAPGDGVCNVDPARRSTAEKLAYVLSHTEAHTHDYAFGRQDYAARAARFLWQHR